MVLNLNILESEEKIVMPVIQSLLEKLKAQGVKANLELTIGRNGSIDMGVSEGETCSCGGSLHLVRNSYGHYYFRCQKCQEQL